MSARHAAALALALVAAPALGAQQGPAAAPAPASTVVAAGVHLQNVRFADGGDATAARLLLVPVAFQQRLGARASLDGYAGFASGNVDFGGTHYTLAGAVDSWLRLRVATTRGSEVALGLRLPSGSTSWNDEQAVTAVVLSNDLLGFREGGWGNGAAVQLGGSTAGTFAGWQLSLAGSYALAGKFQPSADTSLRYQPGDEWRARAGAERQTRAGLVTTGVTVQRFAVDRMEGRNLFQSGTRVRSVATWSRGAWSAAAVDTWRARGELMVPIVDDASGAFLRDSAFAVGAQHLASLQVARLTTWRGRQLLPSLEGRLRARDGRAGDGWALALGADAPFMTGRTDVVPSFRALRGMMVPGTDPSRARGFWGAELGLVVRGGW